MANWRPASPDDIPGILHVADTVHPSLPESGDVFAERIKLFPEGCLILAEGSQICGYAISHPIRQGHPPALGGYLDAIAPDADTYYVHDLAILPAYRGRGLAAECMAQLLQVAKVYESVCLVAVYGTAEFWGRYGFVKVPMDEPLAGKVRGYGDDAVFLLRQREK